MEHYDNEYERNRVSNIFMFFEPLAGWRKVSATNKRTSVNWAYQIQELIDQHYLDIKKFYLLWINLNTHAGASLYKTFTPEEAKKF